MHARCDNAGNYHNASLILGLQALHKQTGVLVKTLNTSEPGYGKVFKNNQTLKNGIQKNDFILGYL